MIKLKIHPVAALFPPIDDAEFQLLAADINSNGLHQPIVLTPDGTTIVDGINRHKACKEAGVEPKFRNLPKSTTELDIINFIISANMRRRDLSAGQKAMIGLEIAPYLEAEAKQRQRKGGGDQKTVKTRENQKSVVLNSGQPKKKRAGRVVDQVGKQASVSHDTISKAKKVKAASPTLAADVAAGKLSLNDAHKQVRKAEAASQAVAEKEASSRATTTVYTHDGQEAEYQLPKGKAKFNATNDQVSWAAFTWNPVTGCLHNCQYCYAREGAVLNENLRPFYPFGFTPTFYDYRLEAPANSKVPEEVVNDARLGRVFVTSMGDLFGKWVPQEWIEKVFAAAHKSPNWEYLFLTKFPQRYVGIDLPSTAWIGTTIDEQYRVKIAEEAFRKISGVRVKWLSLEPLLAPLEFTDLSMFDFVVIGSQSATEQPKIGRVAEFAPPFEWVARLTEQARAAGCKVYQKPNLIGVTDPQHAGMKLIQEMPDLPPLPRAQGDLWGEAAE
jgi:protein gp37/ParB-like chromosome segregation protein Spo0J